ncbi:serine/threonine-protein kinase LMTK1 isoform X2 [Gouania willdenowi]|uniref:serine/threonine-protein kinase LMTK1 isoform X2 n=1 Tax=Gouania willdenowi TaxID=441366 RepID=UPI0010560AD2|nr:serine/threonine-protein kinase LMTK1-like isoform X2 [Gouania willdenowi]
MTIRRVQLLKSSDIGRHSLLYLKEIGHGWFGKVLLGEVNAGLSTTQVVVKELKASASVQDQMQFLEEVHPFRTLQHPALLQCLAQCSEVTPYLLVMEFCPMGDLKSYLRTYRLTDSETPDPLILQRMVCDIASGLQHLHKYNFIHSDLALRNCLLTSEMSVKIGDYGLSQSRYKDDYYITQDQIWVPLRWIAPELIDEVHGNLLVVDQTKSSNIWSFGVTIWELFELGNQPYMHYSDRQVLTYAVKEQQLKLPKPELQFPLSDRWYEVMQFCWLQPELRPCSEELQLLVTYLCAKGSSEAEEDFEQRWNALKPNLLGSATHATSSTALVLTPSPAPADVSTEEAQAGELASSASSFPLLEHFSDSFHSDTGDDLLTVTETSHGLNFEYKWEQAAAEPPYCSSSASGPLGQENPHYQDLYYSNKGSTLEECGTENMALNMSSSYYEPEHLGVVPVLSAHSPSVSSEYYIRIEEPVECNIIIDDTIADYSPGLEAGNRRLSCESRTIEVTPSSYWSTADNTRITAYDSDSSPSLPTTMHPSTSSAKLNHTHNCLSSNSSGTPSTASASKLEKSPHLQSDFVHHQLEPPRSVSKVVSSPSLGFCDPYLEANTGHESCQNPVRPLRNQILALNHVGIDIEADEGLLVGDRKREETVSDCFSEAEATNWISNHSANNNSLSFDSRPTDRTKDSYLDLHYSSQLHTTELWSLTKATTKTFLSSRPCDKDSTNKVIELSSNIHVCGPEHEGAALEENLTDNVFKINSSTGLAENTRSTDGGKPETQLFINRRSSYSEMSSELNCVKSPFTKKETHTGQPSAWSNTPKSNIWEGMSTDTSLNENRLKNAATSESQKALDSRVEVRNSSACLAELADYSLDDDDDLSDLTMGLFSDFNLDYTEEEEEDLSPQRNPVGTPHPIDTINLLSSSAKTCEQAFSPDPFSTLILPKSLDSGYDTENNESPDFLFKELGDSLGGDGSQSLRGEPEIVVQVGLGQVICSSTNASEIHFKSLADKRQYRDSAYFSDFENERSPQESSTKFFGDISNFPFFTERLDSVGDADSVKKQFNTGTILTNLKNVKSCALVNFSEPNNSLNMSFPAPGVSMLSPFPQQMGGCLTKASAPADNDLGLETEDSGDEPPSELGSSIGSEPSYTAQEASASHEEGSRKDNDCSPVQSLHSDSTISDYGDESSKDNETRDGSTEDEELPEFNHIKKETEVRVEGVRINEEDFEDIDAEECDSLCEESNGPVNLSTSSSLLELCGEDVRAPLEEAEDEDSDDSESDEELRTYNIQDEDNEESEEDFSGVPVVVSDCSRARTLRSLLKMPTLLTQSLCEELESKKKAVSFFDDVTVFLFDQESPTGELAEFAFSSGVESGEPSGSEDRTTDLQPSSEPETQPCETFSVPEERNENCSEKGLACEDGDDVSSEHCPSSPETEPMSTPASESNSPDSPKPVPVNRFMVSRFSITQVSDSHAASETGNTEDCPDD